MRGELPALPVFRTATYFLSLAGGRGVVCRAGLALRALMEMGGCPERGLALVDLWLSS